MMNTLPSLMAPDFLKLLAHDVRWQLLTALAESDRRVQELVERLGRPQNLVSYHLRQLRDHHLVTERRSSADGRDVYYSLDLEQLRSMYLTSGQALHPALGLSESRLQETADLGPGLPFRVLFLCTQNSARSQMAEGILRVQGKELVEVFSAGSHPSAVHPLALRAMTAMDIDISQQYAKHIDAFAGQRFDYVITVCDQVREVCPVFPDDPEQIHWSFEDPAVIEGPEAARYQAFLQTARQLTTRIGYLLLMMKRRKR